MKWTFNQILFQIFSNWSTEKKP